MIRSFLSLTISLLLVCQAAPAMTTEQITLKATQIPIGGIVEVKTRTGKWKGQLLSLDSTGVTVRTALKDSSITDQAIAFADMKDIKAVDTSSRATKGFAIFGGVMLVWMIVGAIIFAAAGGA